MAPIPHLRMLQRRELVGLAVVKVPRQVGCVKPQPQDVVLTVRIPLFSRPGMERTRERPHNACGLFQNGAPLAGKMDNFLRTLSDGTRLGWRAQAATVVQEGGSGGKGVPQKGCTIRSDSPLLGAPGRPTGAKRLQSRFAGGAPGRETVGLMQLSDVHTGYFLGRCATILSAMAE